MTDIENYHNWLRDVHAMEKQALLNKSNFC